jgi:hypothetical protein
MGPSVGYPQATQDGLRAGSGRAQGGLRAAKPSAGLHSHSSVKGSAGVSSV